MPVKVDSDIMTCMTDLRVLPAFVLKDVCMIIHARRLGRGTWVLLTPPGLGHAREDNVCHVKRYCAVRKLSILCARLFARK